MSTTKKGAAASTPAKVTKAPAKVEVSTPSVAGRSTSAATTSSASGVTASKELETEVRSKTNYFSTLFYDSPCHVPNVLLSDRRHFPLRKYFSRPKPIIN